VTAHRCPLCEGVWIADTDLLEAIRLEAREHGVDLRTIGLLDGVPQPTDFPCPACGAHLGRLTLRGVEVERCPDCRGVFLEYGEGRRITKRVMRASAEWGPAHAALQRLMRERFRGRDGDGGILPILP